MPISRYRCKKCGKEFQIFQKITDAPLKKCSFCDGKVELIPTPLFYNTPSFSLAFVEKEEKQASAPKTNTKKVQKKKTKPEKKQTKSKQPKKKQTGKKQKTNKNKKMKK